MSKEPMATTSTVGEMDPRKKEGGGATVDSGSAIRFESSAPRTATTTTTRPPPSPVLNEHASITASSASTTNTDESPKPADPTDGRKTLWNTVSDLQEAASFSLATVKEWAAAMPSPQKAAQSAGIHDPVVWGDLSDSQSPSGSSPTGNLASPIHLDQLVDSISAMASPKNEQEVVPTGYKSPKHIKNPPTSAHLGQTLMQDILSPFLACTTGSSPIRTRRGRFKSADGLGSVASWDTAAEDEAMQIQRLTSWGTFATFGTQNTEITGASLDTEATTNSYGESNPYIAAMQSTAAGVPPEGATLDDDGRAIPQALLEVRMKRRERKKIRRQRIVKFDYPPISSLREVSRPDPNMLPNLFFTEEELDEIEADRSSTNIADDVEIVALAASTPSSEEGLTDDEQDIPQSNSSGSSGYVGFGGYQATPKVAQQQLRSSKGRSGTPGRKRNSSKGRASPSPSPSASPHKSPRKQGSRKQSPKPSARTKSPKASPRKASRDPPAHDQTGAPTPTRNSESSSGSQRMLKGVQIYLRERSTGPKDRSH